MGAGGNGAVRPATQGVIVRHYAPPANASTGVADYAAALAQALSQFDEVVPDTSAASAFRADVHLYHLGNNRLHQRIYRHALERPGVIVLHDATLHHLMLGTLSEQEYVKEFVYNYGEWSQQTAQDLWRNRATAGTDPRYFRYPMLRRILEHARAVIVHNPGAAAMARAALENGPRVSVIPHLSRLSQSINAAARNAFRRRLGISDETVLFGIFGYLREPKRIPACIAAFRRLHAIRPNAALLIAGETVSGDLARLLELEAAHPAIRRCSHLGHRDFETAIAAVDCCLNLRYPGAGETSGIVIQAMASARSVILSDTPENSDYPEETCLRVMPGPAEMAELLDYMLLVYEFPALAREIGLAAQQHVRIVHAPERVAALYDEVLQSAVAEQPPGV